ncbi:hypothetical protein Tco_0624219 [Tanacetum coccineum]|uniref:Uncharacterized protein n=1 Tax=Tanacetum coccineum TaxID=301880 RepID=A0ABQ4WDC2_9ASTR
MSNQQDIYAVRAERLAKTHDPLALMANTQTSFHPDQPSHIIYMQHPQPNNNYVQQPPFNANYMQQPMQNPEDISDPTTAIDMALADCTSGYEYGSRQKDANGNHLGWNAVQNSNIWKTTNQKGNRNIVAARDEGNVKPKKRDAANLQTQLKIAQKEEAKIQLNSEEFDFMAATGAYDKIEEVNSNCTLKDNLQQASTSGTQTDKAPVYDSDGSAEVHHSENCYDNDIFNMFTQEEQYTELLDPTSEPHQVQQNDNNVISAVSSMEQSGGTVEQNPANVEETQVFLSQKSKTCEELYFSNASNPASVSKLVSKIISIPNEEFLDDTSPSVARKFLNEVKSTIVTHQRVVKQKMTLDIHNWSSTAHQELHRIVKDEIFPIVNQVDARVQNFKIQFLKEATKFVRDFKSLAKEAVESLTKHKALEYEIKRLLKALEKEYAILWNNWYKKCEECKYDKISYDNAYKDMQQKIKQLQAQLGDLKSNSKDTPCVSDTLDPLSQKLEDENMSLEFQTTLRNKEATIAHLTCETKTVLSEKKTLEDKYLEEIVCLKSANQVATGLLQKFQMPTQTIPMLSKKPMIASSDIHKIGLGFSNPWYGRKAQLSQPALYDGHRLLQPGHARVTVHDSDETLLETEVICSSKGTVREQAYWLSATNIASLTSDPPKPVTPFVRTSPAKSQVQDQLWYLKAEFSQFDEIIKERTTPRTNYLQGMKPAAGVSKTQSKSDNQKSRVLPSKNVSARRIEDHPRNLNKKKNVNSSLYVKRFGYVSNKNVVCGACDKCLVSFNHDSCLVINVPSMNTMHAKKPQVARPKTTPKYIRKTDITVAPRIVPYGAQ